VTSLILRVTSRSLLPGLVLLSLWVLFRGHNAPGGGFVGGLFASTGFALRVFASGADAARAELRVSPPTLIGIGLLIALLSGLVALIQGGTFLEALWLPELPLIGAKLGTPLLFDVGIYFLVIGAVLAPMLALSEIEAR
jgi:multicomponent Na+:H+ antiporter subunit B